MLWFWLALAGAVSWGASYALVERVVQTINFWVYFVIAYTIGFAMIGLYLYLTPISLKTELTKLTDANLWPAAIASALTFMFGNIFIFIALSRHNASEVNLVEITYPLFTCLIAWLILKTYTPHWGFFLALTLILAGVATLYLTTPR